MLVALVLILLAQLDDLFKDLNVKALILGLGEDLFLGFVQVLDLVLDLLDALYMWTGTIGHRSKHLVNSTHPGSTSQLSRNIRTWHIPE